MNNTRIKPMESPKTSQKKAVKPSKEEEAPRHTARERLRAVLSIWTEHRKPAEICRELKINSQLIHNWQDRALKGMLQALEPRLNLEKGPALPPRLQKYLEKRLNAKAASGNMTARLESRLQKIQSVKA